MVSRLSRGDPLPADSNAVLLNFPYALSITQMLERDCKLRTWIIPGALHSSRPLALVIVSGTAAGPFFGVAKSASIIGIKCIDDNGAGSTADIISAINLRSRRQHRPARLGGPDGDPSVTTVGATNITDDFAGFSNFGSNLDVLAPGQDVLSCGITSDDAVQGRPETSMSTPHVAGLAALIMGPEGKLPSAALKQRIVALGVSSVISAAPAWMTNILGDNGATLA